MKDKHPSETVFGFGIFIAAAWLYIKTAHVMSFFAPQSVSELLGFDVSFYFGMGAAALVEIEAIAFHYWPRTRHTLVGRLGMWSLLGISGLCQIVDGYIVQGTQAQMGPFLKDFLTVGVPLVPLYAMVLLFAAAAGVDEQDNAQESERPTAEPRPVSRPEPKGFPGIAPTVTKAFNRVWRGDTDVQTGAKASDTDAVETANPTTGGGSNHR